MSLRDEMKLTKCRDDLVITEFSLMYFLLAKKREITQEDCDKFTLMIMKSSLYPDLLAVTSSYQAGVMDYVALTTAACFVDYSIALGLFHYGQNTYVSISRFVKLRFFYNNVNPGKSRRGDAINWKAWLGKSPSVIAHFEFAAWRNPPLWRKLCWAARVISSSYGSDLKHQERNLIAWLMVETAKKNSRICDFAIWVWRSKFETQYPQGIQYLVSSLFGPHHPLAKYWIN